VSIVMDVGDHRPETKGYVGSGRRLPYDCRAPTIRPRRRPCQRQTTPTNVPKPRPHFLILIVVLLILVVALHWRRFCGWRPSVRAGKLRCAVRRGQKKTPRNKRSRGVNYRWLRGTAAIMTCGGSRNWRRKPKRLLGRAAIIAGCFGPRREPGLRTGSGWLADSDVFAHASRPVRHSISVVRHILATAESLGATHLLAVGY